MLYTHFGLINRTDLMISVMAPATRSASAARHVTLSDSDTGLGSGSDFLLHNVLEKRKQLLLLCTQGSILEKIITNYYYIYEHHLGEDNNSD